MTLRDRINVSRKLGNYPLQKREPDRRVMVWWPIGYSAVASSGVGVGVGTVVPSPDMTVRASCPGLPVSAWDRSEAGAGATASIDVVEDHAELRQMRPWHIGHARPARDDLTVADHAD